MATTDQLLDLEKEVTCSMCNEYFKEPVIMECGHNFCEACLTQSWMQAGVHCPQCQLRPHQKDLQPNRQLANLVNVVQEMVSTRKKREAEHLCDKHDKEICLFCQEDEQVLCKVCILSGDHAHHNLISIEEAGLEYKKILQTHLEHLKSGLEHQMKLPAKEQKKRRELEVKFNGEREKIIKEFDTMEELMKTEKNNLNISLERQKKKILHKVRRKVAQLPTHGTPLRNLMREIEGKCQESGLEFLKDLKSTLSRCETLKLHKSEADSPDIQNDLYIFQLQYNSMMANVMTLKGSFIKELAWKQVCKTAGKGIESKNINEKRKTAETGGAPEEPVPEGLEWSRVKNYAREVTLDPDTACRWLGISEDRRSVIRVHVTDVRDAPERYNVWPCVLGQEMLTRGRHYWEVRVGNIRDWTLGVCDPSAGRRGNITLAPYRGYWAIGLRNATIYKAYTSLHITFFTPQRDPKTVGVFLDYEAGIVAFYNAEQRSLLFTFPPSPFPPMLRPYFCTWSVFNPLRLIPDHGL
ncbi:E3 ubiquitin-protein ligase TRIM39-like [Ambystoma mexicanum]|uniref:E3 ubiquitin-protein ligase TRIM39-like n=1 Tax=Ambystoma mexicanum TaxID=8296 RepID=UPI0037E8DA8F